MPCGEALRAINKLMKKSPQGRKTVCQWLFWKEALNRQKKKKAGGEINSIVDKPLCRKESKQTHQNPDKTVLRSGPMELGIHQYNHSEGGGYYIMTKKPEIRSRRYLHPYLSRGDHSTVFFLRHRTEQTLTILKHTPANTAGSC